MYLHTKPSLPGGYVQAAAEVRCSLGFRTSLAIDVNGDQQVRAGELVEGSQSHSTTAAAVVSIFVDEKRTVVQRTSCASGPSFTSALVIRGG